VSADLQLLWDQWPWLQAKARALAGDDGDDLAQETLAAAWRYWDRWDPSRPLRPWLYTALRWRWMRTAFYKVEAQNRRRHVSLDEPVGDDPDGDVFGNFIPAHQPAADSGAYEILAALPADLADMVEAQYMGGYSTDEAAVMFGVPRGTVGSRMHKARRAARTTTLVIEGA
jgi:RNA polymerase sigma-70 factor, ECF subfamily